MPRNADQHLHTQKGNWQKHIHKLPVWRVDIIAYLHLVDFVLVCNVAILPVDWMDYSRRSLHDLTRTRSNAYQSCGSGRRHSKLFYLKYPQLGLSENMKLQHPLVNQHSP